MIHVWIKFFMANIYLKWREKHINICSCCCAVFCGQCAFSQVIITDLFNRPLLKRQMDDFFGTGYFALDFLN